MLTEDDLPRPKPALVAAPPLDRLGIDELKSYVAALQLEIKRAEAEINRKKAVLDAAQGFFRTP